MTPLNVSKSRVSFQETTSQSTMSSLLEETVEASKRLRYEATQGVWIGTQLHTSSFWLSETEGVSTWPPSRLNDIHHDDLAKLPTQGKELLLIGTGSEHLLPNQATKQHLTTCPIPYELMHNQAACMTYNMMRSDDRSVLLAMLLG